MHIVHIDTMINIRYVATNNFEPMYEKKNNNNQSCLLLNIVGNLIYFNGTVVSPKYDVKHYSEDIFHTALE